MPTVDSYDKYTFQGKQYLTVRTSKNKAYEFTRLRDDEPFTFSDKWKCNGEEFGAYGVRTPQCVIEFLRENYDCANLHTDPKRIKVTRKHKTPDQ